MGSQNVQAQLWGKRARYWAAIQEQTASPGYDYVFEKVPFSSNVKLLDVGCGAGLFCKLAYNTGAQITGIDASEALIAEARVREPRINFLTGEMEELPFEAGSFDLVCGFNSFQYAENTLNAFKEASRVLTGDGILVAMIWGNKEDCEAAAYLKAVGSLLPPPPPGAQGPFALSENGLLESKITEAGFSIVHQADIDAVWSYPDLETALKGLMSAGPVTRAIDLNSAEKVHDAIALALQPYVQSTGQVILKNKFRIVIGKK